MTSIFSRWVGKNHQLGPDLEPGPFFLIFGTCAQQLRYKYIKAKGEFHMNNPEMARALHQAVRNNEPLAYEESRVNNMETFQPDFCPDVFFQNFCGNLNLQIFFRKFAEE